PVATFILSLSLHDALPIFMTDILISDYSSVPFEFSLMCKPMVFFAYDLEEYAHSKGFWENYAELVPGPVVKNTDDLIDVLKNGRSEEHTSELQSRFDLVCR